MSVLLALFLVAAVDPSGVADPFAVAAPAPPHFDRAAVRSRSLELLSGLVAVDTTNGRAEGDALPEGNELAAALFLAEHVERFAAPDGPPRLRDHVLQAVAGGPVPLQAGSGWPDAGLSVDVLVVAPHRANLVVRLSATSPSERPVLVMGHLDVVGAQADAWDSDPFRATIRDDGYVYGRGAIDCKGPLAAGLTALLSLVPLRDALSRDIVFLATAAEEGGSPVGIDMVLAEFADVLGDPEFALNEGGRIRIGADRIVSVNIQTTEKLAYNLRLEASGPSGHGSVPLPDNALAALARACARLHVLAVPARLNATTRLFFERQAGIETDAAMAAAMTSLVNSAPDSDAFLRAVDVLDDDPLHNAALRAGLALTRLDGGFRNNVIPSTGSAVFNLRVPPDEDMDALLRRVREVAAEPSVTITLDRPPRAGPPVSSVDTALYRAMESAAHAMDPRITVLPFMSNGATDGAALRAAGIPTYGILPIPLRMEDELRMHGDEERAPVDGLPWAAEYLYRVLLGVAR